MTPSNASLTWLSEQPKIQTDYPAWLTHFRQTHWDKFQTQTLPTRHDEEWKYTDLSCLTKQVFAPITATSDIDLQAVVEKHALTDAITIVVVNGVFDAALSNLTSIPKEAVILSIQDALQQFPTLVEAQWQTSRDSYFTNLNAALFTDGLFIYIPPQCKITQPIHLLAIANNAQSFVTQPRHVIVVSQHAQLQLIEEHISVTNEHYFTNTAMTVSLEESAVFDYCKLQTAANSAIHLASVTIDQAQQSECNLANFSLGALFARDEVLVNLNGQGANCHAVGFYDLHHPDQYIDNHLTICHAAPHSHSEMLYKGIVREKARAVFNGRLHVKPDAQKILAYQANHNLLLHSGAEVYSKPELEIYADDVKCKHGATTGQIDEEALFYLRARGIAQEEATMILLRGFAEEILQRAGNAQIAARVMNFLPNFAGDQ